MSKRMTRSMTTRIKRRRESDCSVEEPIASENKSPPANPDALGSFCVLPTKIIEEILSFLPLKTISTLALVSGEWQRFLRNWLETSRTVIRLARNIYQNWNLDLLADLIRRSNLTKIDDPGIKHLQWARNILKKLQVVWHTSYGYRLNLLTLGTYLRKCLKSPADEKTDLKKFSDAGYLEAINAGAQIHINEELKELIHQLFNNDQLMVFAVDFITSGYDHVSKAYFVIKLFSPSEGKADDISALAAVLNKWWKDDENQTILITNAVLKEPIPLGTYRVAMLLAKLNVNLVARVLEDLEKMQRVLAAMAEIDGDATLKLIESLRKKVTDVDSNAMLRYVHHVVEKEINFVNKRCRRSFLADLSDGPFELLHNLELVSSATSRMLLEESPDSPDPVQDCSQPPQDCPEPLQDCSEPLQDSSKP